MDAGDLPKRQQITIFIPYLLRLFFCTTLSYLYTVSQRKNNFTFWPYAIIFVLGRGVHSSKHLAISEYRIIHKSVRNFQPLRYSSLDGHAKGEHVNRGRDTPSFCPTLQVLDISTLGYAADVNPVIRFLTIQTTVPQRSEIAEGLMNYFVIFITITAKQLHFNKVCLIYNISMDFHNISILTSFIQNSKDLIRKIFSTPYI